MIEALRHKKLLEILEGSDFATLPELISKTDASAATIRRDLIKLEKGQQIRRVRGGAEISSAIRKQGLSGIRFDESQTINLNQKKAIARVAAQQLKGTETILMDGGTTTFQMIEFIRPMNLKILTNSLPIANALYANTGNTVVLIGGEIFPEQKILINPFADNFLKNYCVDKLFMGAQGVTAQGVSNTDTILIRTEQLMIEASQSLILLVDSSKFERSGNLKLCSLDKVSKIITDDGVKEETLRMIKTVGVEVVVAPT